MAGRLAATLVAALVLASARAYLVLVPDSAPPGSTVLDAAVYKLGSERTYTIDVHRTANFVHHVLRVNQTTGLVTSAKDCGATASSIPTCSRSTSTLLQTESATSITIACLSEY